MISRRQLMHDSAIVAGGLAVAPQLNQQRALAQADLATPPASISSMKGRVLDVDIPGLEIGVAEYAEIPTGCTVFNFDLDLYPDGVMLEADIRGGEPGYANVYSATNAISFAGGSVYGLEAATGAASELYAQSGYRDLITVAGAIIYDISVVEPPDGFRALGIYPDKALGQEAVRHLAPGQFPLGMVGAGAGATVGQWVDFPHRRERGGQGGAYRQIGPIKVAFFAVVNALGVIVDRQGQVVRGGLNPETGERPLPLADAEAILKGDELRLQPALPGGKLRHTTISLLVTNVALPRELMRQMGRQVHSSMARAIHPFHTPDDGDLLFTVSTGEVPGEEIDSTALGIVASELAWDAILSCFEGDGVVPVPE